MTWDALLSIIQDEADAEVCARIEERIRQELSSITIYIPSRPAVSREDVREIVRLHHGNVDKAARALGISRATVYRKLRPQQQTRTEPGPRLPGTWRTVR